jgi:hypothetical protein
LRAAADQEHRDWERFKPEEPEGTAAEGPEGIAMGRQVSQVFLTREVEVGVRPIVEVEVD